MLNEVAEPRTRAVSTRVYTFAHNWESRCAERETDPIIGGRGQELHHPEPMLRVTLFEHQLPPPIRSGVMKNAMQLHAFRAGMPAG